MLPSIAQSDTSSSSVARARDRRIASLSKSVAEKLGSWLHELSHAVEPFVSTNIPKGDAWFITLFEQLRQCPAGIVCVTREDLHSDWLLFEAGALAKQVDRPRVCTLLIDVSPLEVPAPLSGFQATMLKKDDADSRVARAQLHGPALARRERRTRHCQCVLGDLPKTVVQFACCAAAGILAADRSPSCKCRGHPSRL
jgi:hypothetical protein